jgi:hypothetical protein
MAIPIALAEVVAVVVRVAKAVPAEKGAVGAAAPSLSSSGIMALMESFGTVLSPWGRPGKVRQVRLVA